MINAVTTPAALAQLSDYSTFTTDPATGLLVLDMTPRRIVGPVVVVEWVARAWFTPRRSLAWAVGRGVDVRDLENATFGPGELLGWKQSLTQEAMKTPFVASCALALAFADRTTTIDGRLVLVDGKVYPLMLSLGVVGPQIQIA